MDPIANLQAQRARVAEINTIKDRWPATGDPPAADVGRLQDLAEQLAELVEALDVWRNSGGFDPYPKVVVAPCRATTHERMN